MTTAAPGQDTAIIVHATDANFEREVVQEALPVVVDFWAPWCAPCRAMGAALEKVAPRLTGSLKIVKVNVDENPEIAGQFGISSIPTLIFFRGGQALGALPGALPAEPLREILTLHAQGKLEAR